MSISAINLGSTFSNNGKATTSGLSSGLNTKATIDSIVAAQSSQITALNAQVSVQSKQASAVNTLKTLLQAVQTAATPLSNPQSLDPAKNVFAQTNSQITSNTSQAASNYLTASVSTGAAAGNYNLSITTLATNEVQQTNAFSNVDPASTSVVGAAYDSLNPNANAGIFSAGTFVIHSTVNGTPTNTSITLTQGQNLNQVATAFNNVSTQTGFTAQVVQTGASQYKLVFTATGTGTAAGFDLTSNSSLTDASNVFSGITIATAQPASNASFKLNGVDIVRSTNTVSDVISGVTLNLLQSTSNQAGANISLTIATDVNAIQKDIDNFATAYNNFLSFYSQQTQLNSNGTAASSATLYSDTSLRTIYNSVSQAASSIVSGLASGSNALTDIGISFQSYDATDTQPAIDNVLSVNDSTLLSALQSNLSKVKNILGYNLTSSSSKLSIAANPTSKAVSSYTVNIDQTSGTYTLQYTSPTTGSVVNETFTSSALGSSGGLLLKPPTTSELAGLQLIYDGNGSSVENGITVSTTDGITSKINDFLTSALTATTGLVATEQQAITDKTTAIQTQITNVQTQIQTTRDQLTSKYSRLEASINKANTALQFLNASQAQLYANA